MTSSALTRASTSALWLLVAAVALLGAVNLAHATWVSQGPHDATMGTDSPYALNDKFSVDSSGNASTNVRVRCTPCPTCVYLPQVNYSWVATWRDSAGDPVATSQNSGGVQHECKCPSSAFSVTGTGCENAVSVDIAVTVTCSCCDEQGWVWTETLQEEHDNTVPVLLEGTKET